MAEVAELAGPFRLRVKVSPLQLPLISEFCRRYLMPELRHSSDAVWFDHCARPGIKLFPRRQAYLAAMFILSNVSRYNPEFLDDSVVGTNLGYVLTEFLDNAERFFPQLMLELAEGEPIFFE